MHPHTDRSIETSPARGRRSARLVALVIAAVVLVGLIPAAQASAGTRDSHLRIRRDGRTLVVRGRGFPEDAKGRVRIRTASGRVKIRRFHTTGTGRWSERVFVGRSRRGTLKIRARVHGEVRTLRMAGTVRFASTKRRKPPTTDTTTTTNPPPTPSPAAGLSGPVGPDQDYAPAGISVAVGELDQSLFNNNPTGAAFVLAPGVHRITGPVYPRTGQQVLGKPGAVISGAKVLSSWRHDGSWWVADNQNQRLPRVSDPDMYCRSDWRTCVMSEDVFFDNKALRQVSSLADLAPGRFWFDYSNSRIYLADDPNGHSVETTVAESAFGGGAGSGVLLRNLVIEKFGNPAQTGAIRTGTGWTVARCTVRLNHGQGLVGNSNTFLHSNRILFNGQAGMGGTGVNMRVENNEVAHSNTMGFATGWSAAGAKWYETDGLIVRNNWVHDNDSHGFWTDINNINTLYESNLFENNSKTGIYHEISYSAIIRNNVVRRSYDGATDLSWADGAGIKVEASRNVQVVGNVLQNNPKGIMLTQVPRGEEALYGAHEISGVSVRNNDVSLNAPYVGLTTWNVSNPGSYFTLAAASFEGNTYRLSGEARTAAFAWDGRYLNADQWRAAGQDINGTFVYQ